MYEILNGIDFLRLLIAFLATTGFFTLAFIVRISISNLFSEPSQKKKIAWITEKEEHIIDEYRQHYGQQE